MPQRSIAKVVALAVAFCGSMFGQLNQNCTVSVLNRTIKVNADGSWVLPNIPANFGQVKARATCVQSGVTTFGESDFFSVPANGAVNLPDIKIGNTTLIPAALTVNPLPPVFTTIGQTFQLTVQALYPNSSTKDVSVGSTGTNYTTSNSAIASITANGLLTAVASGTVVVQATNDGATGIISVRVILSGTDTDGDGIPDSAETSLGLDPRNAIDAQEDFDRDGLTNLREYLLGTDLQKADTDGDGLTDGAEVDTYHTNPLVVDTDGDGIPDGIEVQTSSDPNNPSSFNLSKALRSLVVTPAAFTLVVNALSPQASQQLTVTGILIDGKTTINLNSTQRGTAYTSDNIQACNFGSPDGRIFAGIAGTCKIGVTSNGFSATAVGTVSNFNPVERSITNISGSLAVDVAGDFAYVAKGTAGFTVVDVSNRSQPQVRGTLSSIGNVQAVRVFGSNAFVADGNGFLRVLDVTNPDAPTLIASIPIPGVPTSLSIHSSVAAIAAQGGGVTLVSLATPAAPSILSTFSTPASALGADFDLPGKLAAVAMGTGGLQVVDISNLTAPILRGRLIGGDVRRVLLRFPAALLADASRSFSAANLANPNSPVLASSVPSNLGGSPVDLAASGNFAFTADVSFGRAVPIVNISNSLAPVSLGFWTISPPGFGSSIAMDLSFAYLIIPGSLRIFQYQEIVDNGGIPPAVQITSPTSGPLIQGSTITFSANATDDVAVASVSLLVNGQPVFTGSAPPYQAVYPVPANASTLTFGAVAVDYGNNVGTAANITLPVIPDPLTSAHGRLIDPGGVPVSGAAASAFGISTTTATDGTFTLSGLSTIQGPISVTGVGTQGGIVLAGASASVQPVRGGITEVGDIQLGPKPVISSVAPPAALAGGPVIIAVTGGNFVGASFSFVPAGITIDNASIDPDGKSAKLNLTVGLNVLGTFGLVATSSAGSTPTSIVPHVNRFTTIDPNSTADSDHDSFQDVIEAVLGTDPLDATDIPVIPVARETESTALSVLNAPVTGAGIRETESITLSVLNAPVTGAGSRETESITLSVLNAPVTGAGSRETESITLSVLNAPVTGAGLQETESITFSALNSPFGLAGIRETSSYFSLLNNAVGVLLPKLSLASAAQSDKVLAQDNSQGGGPSEPIDPFTDTDGDGLPDWYELLIGTDPGHPDSDRDGLSDFQESFTYHTDPSNADTDGDGFADGVEVLLGSNPLNPQSTPLNLIPRAATIQSRPTPAASLAANVRKRITQRKWRDYVTNFPTH